MSRFEREREEIRRRLQKGRGRWRLVPLHNRHLHSLVLEQRRDGSLGRIFFTGDGHRLSVRRRPQGKTHKAAA